MLDLTAGEKIILLTSRLNPSQDIIDKIVVLLSNGKKQIDYNRLMQLASLNGVSQFLYKNLRQVDIIPDEVLSQLRSIYFHSSAGNLRKASETIKIFNLLRARGIEAITLKGAIASEIIFSSPGLYYGSDIDILVRPSDLQEVKKTLINSGYCYDETMENDMLLSHYHLVFSNGKHLVEVHWNLVKRYFNIPPEFWWEDAFYEKYEGQEILCLSPERYLMCTIFRLFSHMFIPLKFFVLISEIVNKYNDVIDWAQFAVLIKKYKMKKLTGFTFKLLNEFLDTRLPDKIISKKIAGYDLFKSYIISGLFRDRKRPYLSKVLYVYLLDSPYRMLTLFLGRLFPGKGEIRLRYGISEGSNVIYLYYLLNPVLLPILLLKKRFSSNVKESGAGIQ